MSSSPQLVILTGGVSAERDVSLRSGEALRNSLAARHDARSIVVSESHLPAGLDPELHVIVPVLHGTFGEDGQLQSLLETAGFDYAGCDAASSSLCFDKAATKDTVARAGVRVCPDIRFRDGIRPDATDVVNRLGPELVVKPSCQGSSVGLSVVSGLADLRDKLATCTQGEWIIETRVTGRELTIGILDGKPQGIIEIRPKSGVYDYASKYTAGATEYLEPDDLPADVVDRVEAYAALAFRACGARDFARADFMLSAKGEPFFLEINTLPGLTATSLMPKSAKRKGLDFDQLADALVAPALKRWHSKRV